jgi:hypothetical protein
MTAEAVMQQTVNNEMRGVTEVHLRNDGDIGALVLGSELFICSRRTIEDLVLDINALYSDPDCTFDILFTVGTEIDPKTARIYHRSIIAPMDAPLVQLVSAASYAREDRLRVDWENDVEAYDVSACSDPPLEVYSILDDSRVRGVVEKQRLLVYTETQWQLTTSDESLCEPSRYPLFRYVRLNQEDWIQPRTS